MARAPRDPRLRLDRPGERPLLQGHLRPGKRPAAPPPETADPEPSVQPASEAAKGAADAVRGKATRSPGEVAKRRHLEGSEQGPA